LVAGRNVGSYDTLNGMLVNEQFAATCGYTPEEIVGKMVNVFGREQPIIGVVADFNTASLRNTIEPIMLFNSVKWYKTMALKVNMPDAENVISNVKHKWEAFYPDHIFEYNFLDEDIRSFYDGQRRMASLLALFTSIAIFIGCLGLFGLVSYMTNQKTKEIGVRKVLGATLGNILVAFLWSYVRFIIVGFLLAIPAAWFIMQQFLNEFAYRIPLTPWIFVSAFLMTLTIALLTVGYKSLKTAMTDPIRSLRYE
jgi:putative ABC transport system permease protein